MAFDTNSLITSYGTSADAVTTTGASLVATAGSNYGSAGQWTNDEQAPRAGFVLTAQWATATDIGGKTIGLFARLHNINSTNDASAPSDDNPVIRLGSFVVPSDTATTDLYMPLSSGVVELPNYYSDQVFEFYIKNNSGQTISVNWQLHIFTLSEKPQP